MLNQPSPVSGQTGCTPPSFEYDSLENLLANLEKRVVGPAEAKVLELQRTG